MFIIAVIWSAFFVTNFNIAMMIPLLPFMQQEMAMSSHEAGAVLAALPIAALIGNLVLGPLIDRYGRRRFIMLGSALCGLLFLLTAFARTTELVILYRALAGFCMPMVGASVFGAVADYFPPTERVRITGYVASAAPMAILLSMSLGVVLGGLVGWQAPMLGLAAAALVLSLCTRWLPPTRSELLSTARITPAVYRQRLLSFSLNARTRLILLCYLTYTAATFVFLGLYPSWIVGGGAMPGGPGTTGWLLFLGGLGGLAGAMLSGRLSRLLGEPLQLCAVAAAITALIVLVVPLLTGSFGMQAVAYGGFAFGRDLMLSLMLSGTMMLVPAAERGSLNAMVNVLYQTGSALGALAGAWLYAFRPDFLANAAFSAILFLATGTVLWQVTRRRA